MVKLFSNQVASSCLLTIGHIHSSLWTTLWTWFSTVKLWSFFLTSLPSLLPYSLWLPIQLLKQPDFHAQNIQVDAVICRKYKLGKPIERHKSISTITVVILGHILLTFHICEFPSVPVRQFHVAVVLTFFHPFDIGILKEWGHPLSNPCLWRSRRGHSIIVTLCFWLEIVCIPLLSCSSVLIEGMKS